MNPQNRKPRRRSSLQKSKGQGSDDPEETAGQSAAAIALCLFHLRDEALTKGLDELAHCIGVAVEAAMDALQSIG